MNLESNEITLLLDNIPLPTVILDIRILEKNISEVGMEEFLKWGQSDENFNEITDVLSVAGSNKEIMELLGRSPDNYFLPTLFTEESRTELLKLIMKAIYDKNGFSRVMKITVGKSMLCQVNCRRLMNTSYIILSFTPLNISEINDKQEVDIYAKYRNLFDKAPIGIITCDSSRENVEFNKHALELLGYTDADLVNITQEKLYPQITRENYHSNKEILEKGGVVHSNIKIMKKNGTFFESESIITTYGKNSIQIIFQDVTKLKKIEKMKRDVEIRLQFIIDNTPIIIWICDPNGIILFIEGRKELEKLGLTERSLIGSSVYESIDQFPILSSTIKAMNGEPYMSSIEIEGTYFNFVIKPVNNKNGELEGILGISLNVTEQRITETQLFQSQKMNAIGRVAGKVNHELNNILMAIMTYSELILESDDINSIKEDVESIKQATTRAKDLTDLLNSFSKSGYVRTSVFSLNSLLRRIETMISGTIGENVSFKVETPSETIVVKSDQSRIETAVLNLIMNSKEAITRQGIISISLDKMELKIPKQTRFGTLLPGVYACIMVRDNGMGIDKNIMQKLFEPFYTTKSNAAGLGLSSVFGVIDKSDGAVEIHSEKGMGTEVKLYLPISDELLTEHPDESGNAINDKKYKILVVDDDEIILDTISRILKKYSSMVLSAHGPKRAIELWNEHYEQLDIILTDILMAEMNGFELIKELKSIATSKVPVLYMTGFPGDYLSENKDLDEDAHILKKPFTSDELIKALKSVYLKNR